MPPRQPHAQAFSSDLSNYLAFGVSRNIGALDKMQANDRDVFLKDKAKKLWDNEVFKANSGGGTRGTTRLVNLLPMAEAFLKPE